MGFANGFYFFIFGLIPTNIIERNQRHYGKGENFVSLWQIVSCREKKYLLLGLCFGIVNHAKLCVFYWVLMCLKVVIEDKVEDTKFAQEKFKKTHFQHVPQ